MLKYRGKYRVRYECDKRIGKALESTYIPCNIKKGANIYRHSDNKLNAYVPSLLIIKRLLKKYPDLFRIYQEGDTEGTLLFPESRIGEAAEILKARVRGKSLSPRQRKNYNISEDRRKELSTLMKEMHASGKISRVNGGKKKQEGFQNKK